ncbi:hypothetical protein ACFVVU_36025 [Kitasatospora sp. NPDC057965]|uniref:hypothetical protein n=1 Tax=Kitasatospora sp. NPDC057965 TaxID=3346291 RepID=UPI0036D9DECC
MGTARLVLKSKARSNNTISVVVGAVAIYFQSANGLHGLLTEGLGTGVTVYGLLQAAVGTLRRHRAIELSDPPETVDQAPR